MCDIRRYTLNGYPNMILTADATWLQKAHIAIKNIEGPTSEAMSSGFNLLRQNTFSNLPTGSQEFISGLEDRFGRRLIIGKAGAHRAKDPNNRDASPIRKAYQLLPKMYVNLVSPN